MLSVCYPFLSASSPILASNCFFPLAKLENLLPLPTTLNVAAIQAFALSLTVTNGTVLYLVTFCFNLREKEKEEVPDGSHNGYYVQSLLTGTFG